MKNTKITPINMWHYSWEDLPRIVCRQARDYEPADNHCFLLVNANYWGKGPTFEEARDAGVRSRMTGKVYVFDAHETVRLDDMGRIHWEDESPLMGLGYVNLR